MLTVSDYGSIIIREEDRRTDCGETDGEKWIEDRGRICLENP